MDFKIYKLKGGAKIAGLLPAKPGAQKSQPVTFNVPEELIQRFDAACLFLGCTRSLLLAKLIGETNDEWVDSVRAKYWKKPHAC